MDEQKVKEVLSDEAFVKELLELETPEEVQARLKEKGVDVSVEEIKQLGQALQAYAKGELDEDALENVAGGFVLTAGASLILGMMGGALGLGMGTIGVFTAIFERW